LACFLWPANAEHYLSNSGLCCMCSYWSSLSLTEIWIFSLIFSKPCMYLCYHLSSPKLQTFFEILSWYYPQMSSWLSLLRFSLSTSNLFPANLLPWYSLPNSCYH
jgi:hypothetical protein